MVLRFQNKNQNKIIKLEFPNSIVENLFNNLLIINHKQLQTLPPNLDITAQFNNLQFSDNAQKTQLNRVTFSVNGDLATRQAKVELSADVIEMANEGNKPLLFESLQLTLQLEQNKLSLINFFVNAFSGSLSINADALLTIKLLPEPAIKVQQLILNSLVAKDMKVVIPDSFPFTSKSSNTTEDEALPITDFLVKSMRLQNIDLHSKIQKIPLTDKSADLVISDFYPIKDKKLLDITQLTQQASRFSLTLDHLRWQDMNIEQFSVAGSLNKNDQGLQILMQLLSEK